MSLQHRRSSVAEAVPVVLIVLPPLQDGKDKWRKHVSQQIILVFLPFPAESANVSLKEIGIVLLGVTSATGVGGSDKPICHGDIGVGDIAFQLADDFLPVISNISERFSPCECELAQLQLFGRSGLPPIDVQSVSRYADQASTPAWP